MYKRVLILGGTGFLGYYVLRSLDKAGFDMAILLHRKKDDLDIPFEGYTLLEGDVLNLKTIKSAISKFKPDVIIDMVGSLKTDPRKVFVEATKNILKASQDGGVKKIIYISDLAVNLNKKSAYLDARRDAEKEFKNYIFAWTIFRPSTIFGWRANFTNTIKKQIEGIFPVLIPADKYKLQPIAAENLADSIAIAAGQDIGNSQIYEAVGSEILTPQEIVNRLKASLNSERKIFRVPFFVLKSFAFFKKIGFPNHISSSYIQVFENRTSGSGEYLKKDFGLNEIKFDPAQEHSLY